MWANRSLRMAMPALTADLAAKYWAVSEKEKPTTPRRIRSTPIFQR